MEPQPYVLKMSITQVSDAPVGASILSGLFAIG